MKKINLLFILFVLFVSDSILLGQNPKIDSLKTYLKTAPEDTSKVNALNMLGKEHEFIDQKISINYLKQAMELANRLNFERGLCITYNYLGYLAEDKSEFDSAEVYYTNSYKVALKLDNKSQQAHELKMLGETMEYKGDLKLSLNYFQRSLALYEKIGSKSGIANVNYSLGGLYSELKRNDKAMEYYNVSLKIDRELNIPLDVANSITAIGVIHNSLKNYSEANKCYLEAKKIYEELKDDNGLSNCLTWIAITAYNQNDIPTALDYFKQSLTLYEKINSVNGLMYSYNNIGNIYVKQGDYKKGIEWQIKSLELAQKSHGLEYIRYSYESLSSSYEHMGDYKNAFMYHCLYMRYKDSLLNESTTKQISELDKKFETAQKDKELIVKNAELIKQTAEIDKQTTQRNYLIFGFGIMLLLLILIFVGYRQKQKVNKIIALQKHEVEKQKELLEEKQKEIVDSITYAKRLQQAILPPLNFVQQYFPNSFILFKPKDIVAGDFYWMEVITEDFILIAAADCTGHGVPGAMVSVVCSNALNRTVKEFGITEPGKILDKVRELVIETFQKSESEVKDGMDISLAAIDLKKQKMQWAGANNPLWIVRNNETLEFKGNKQPIGKTEHFSPFSSREIELQKNDLIYLFSDGYADQFGGEKGKKFKYKPLQELFIKIKEEPMNVQQEILSSTLSNWKGSLDQVDDVLIIGIKI